MTPPAPGRLSTITCCPQRSLSFWAVKRAAKSDVLPGEPAIRRTGRVGYSWAVALAHASAMQAATHPKANSDFISPLLCPFALALRHSQLPRHPVGGAQLEHVAAVVGDVVTAFDDEQLARPRDFRRDALCVVRRREL